MKNGANPPGKFPHQFNDVAPASRTTMVDDDRQVPGRAEVQLGTEAVRLPLPVIVHRHAGRRRMKIIETGLADRDNFFVLAETLDHPDPVAQPRLDHVTRMKSDGRGDAVEILCQFDGPAAVIGIGADRNHSRDAGVPRPLDDIVDVVRELWADKMAMGIDQHVIVIS
jgi:hypothetical protein